MHNSRVFFVVHNLPDGVMHYSSIFTAGVQKCPETPNSLDSPDSRFSDPRSPGTKWLNKKLQRKIKTRKRLFESSESNSNATYSFSPPQDHGSYPPLKFEPPPVRKEWKFGPGEGCWPHYLTWGHLDGIYF